MAVTPADYKDLFPEAGITKIGAATPGTASAPTTGGGQFIYKDTPFAKLPEIDFVNSFNENIAKLIQALGLTRRIALNEGTIVRRYGWDKTKAVDWATGEVAEGALIPLTDSKLKELQPIVVGFKKFREQASGELIQAAGTNMAINQKDAQLVLKIQRAIKKEFFANLKTLATAKTQTIGTGLQGAFAEVKGQLEVLFENYGGADQVVVLVNPTDIAKYIGTASLTTNTAFGMNYLVPFTGVTVLPFADVPVGHIYATVPQNLILAYANVNGAAGQAFNLTADQTGLIGITHQLQTDRFAIDTVAITGMQLIAEMPEGVIDMTIKP